MIGDDLLTACRGKQIAVVGSGGKTTLIFCLARNLPRTIITTTTHFSKIQSMLGDQHIDSDLPFEMVDADLNSNKKITVLSSTIVENERVKGPGALLLAKISKYCRLNNTTLLIEADGSRQLPLKAPAVHEPCIPNWVDAVIVVAGLNGLFSRIDDDHIHRSAIFSEIVGATTGSVVSEAHITQYLKSPSGGLKSIPAAAKRFLFLNQAESAEKKTAGESIAENLKDEYDLIVVGSLTENSGGINGCGRNIEIL